MVSSRERGINDNVMYAVIIINNNNYTYKAQISTKCSSALNTDYIKYGSNISLNEVHHGILFDRRLVSVRFVSIIFK